MLISIITPSFNQAMFLERTINSVITQDYSKFEFIIIDGQSTDETCTVIDKHIDKISYFLSEKDNGQSEAINKGLLQSTGDIISYLNSDDVLLPGALRIVSNTFNREPHVDIIYGDYIIIDDQDHVLNTKKEIAFDFNMACMIGFGAIIPQPATFIRRRIFERVGAFREDLHYTMDADYWQRAALAGAKFMHVPYFLAGFRSHCGSKTHSVDTNVMMYWQNEKEALLRQSYNQLWFSKIVPYPYSSFIRKFYRLKRVFKKLVKLRYF